MLRHFIVDVVRLRKNYTGTIELWEQRLFLTFFCNLLDSFLDRLADDLFRRRFLDGLFV